MAPNAMITNPLESIQTYLYRPEVLAKFAAALGGNAKPYIESVMIAVEAKPDLQKCTPESIYISALRAATLQLSCDPAVKQAYLVPYKRNKKVGGNWTSYYEAQFQPHYLGLYTLAMRTNKYSKMDVIPMPKGYTMSIDLHTGEDIILNEKGEPAVFAPKVEPFEAGAWYGYFRTTKGFSKKIWMSVEEIHAHARKFSKSYNADGSLWLDKNHRPTMEKKTVLIELLRWADKSGIGDTSLQMALHTEEVIEAETEDIPPTAAQSDEYDQLPAEWAKPEENPDPVDNDTWDKWERLAEKARALRLVVPNVDRAKTAKADLIEEWKLLSDKVKKAGTA